MIVGFSKNLYPEGIEVLRVKSNNFYTAVQYELDGQKWFAINTAERVLFSKKVDNIQPFCFYGDLIATVNNYEIYVSDPLLFTERLLCSFLPPTVEGDTGKAYIAEAATDICIDNDNIAISYDSYVCWYPLSVYYFTPVEPLRQFKLPALAGISAIASISTKLARFLPVIPKITKSRVVTAISNVEEGVFVEKGLLKPISQKVNFSQPAHKEWKRLIISLNNNSLHYLYDYKADRIIDKFPMESGVYFNSFYYIHKTYNPWHDFRIYKGKYKEEYNPADGKWTQTYEDLAGYWTSEPAFFDLTFDTVTSDGKYTRGQFVSKQPVHVSVIPSNLNLLSKNFIIFQVKITDEEGIPVPFVKVTIEPVAGDTDGEALRYFNEEFGGVSKDHDLTDVDGKALVLLKTVNGDFPEHLQGHWAFKITVNQGYPMIMDDVIDFHGLAVTSEKEMVRDELKKYDELEFLKGRYVFSGRLT